MHKCLHTHIKSSSKEGLGSRTWCPLCRLIAKAEGKGKAYSAPPENYLPPHIHRWGELI